jgi:hypothetical protein
MRFEDEPWGAQTMQDSYGPDIWHAHQKNLIYCAGIIAGEFQIMIDLSLQMYLMSPGDSVHFCDQIALNVLLGSNVYKEITYFAALSESWACHAGGLANPEAIKRAETFMKYPMPHFDGTFVHTASGEIYTLVHQYDRAAEWGPQLESRYNPDATGGQASANEHSLVRRVLSRIRR